jgi:hypothetical protein
MSTVSLIWGILAMVGMLVGFLPCLGSLNWLNIPFSGIGLIISIVAVTTVPPEQRGGAVAGTVMCAIGVGLGFLRLMAGGGIL